MRQARETKRDSRRRNDVASVAIAGYTNAGKSSLLNALTGAGVLVQNALFATLDPTTRRAELPDGREYVMTDTVGFVRHLPTQLVEAFRSTLEEIAQADLLLHVVDASDSHPQDQIAAVRQVLVEVADERGHSLPPELVVVNKIDAADEVTLAQLRNLVPGAVFVSARTGAGVDALRERLADMLPHPEIDATVLLPYDRGDLLARAHAHGEVLSEEHTAEGTHLHARVRGGPRRRVGPVRGVVLPPLTRRWASRSSPLRSSWPWCRSRPHPCPPCPSAPRPTVGSPSCPVWPNTTVACTPPTTAAPPSGSRCSIRPPARRSTPSARPATPVT